MAEDSSYMRERLDDVCSGIARLEEQVKNLFHRYEEKRVSDEKHREDHATISVSLTTLGSRVGAIEETKKGIGEKLWQIVVGLVLAFCAAWIGAKVGK